MARAQTAWIRAILTWGFILGMVPRSASQLAISYCSPVNNAGTYQAAYWQYQSNGWCSTHCQGSYAFAVLQGSNCWCSNYVPEPQVDTLSCNQDCPGDGNEWCGSTQADLYGYYQLSGGLPLGTSGTGGATASSTSSSLSSYSSPSTVSPPASSSGSPAQFSSTSLRIRTTTPSSSSSSITLDPPQSSTQSTATVVVPVLVSTPSPQPLTSTSAAFTTSSSTTVDTSTTEPVPVPVTTTEPSPSPSPTSSPSLAPSVYTMTISGSQIRTTVLVTPTVAPDGTISQSSGGHGVSAGKVAGIVVGVAIACGILIGSLAWACYRHKHRRALAIIGTDNSSYMSENGVTSNTNIPSRQVSQLSSAGLLTKIPRINTSNVAPVNNPRSAGTNGSNFDRLSVGTDQRLNPYALYSHEEGRHSALSLQDNQDYSRQLRVANPDD